MISWHSRKSVVGSLPWKPIVFHIIELCWNSPRIFIAFHSLSNNIICSGVWGENSVDLQRYMSFSRCICLTLAVLNLLRCAPTTSTSSKICGNLSENSSYVSDCRWRGLTSSGTAVMNVDFCPFFQLKQQAPFVCRDVSHAKLTRWHVPNRSRQQSLWISSPRHRYNVSVSPILSRMSSFSRLPPPWHFNIQSSWHVTSTYTHLK